MVLGSVKLYDLFNGFSCLKRKLQTIQTTIKTFFKILIIYFHNRFSNAMIKLLLLSFWQRNTSYPRCILYGVRFNVWNKINNCIVTNIRPFFNVFQLTFVWYNFSLTTIIYVVFYKCLPTTYYMKKLLQI